MTPFLFLRRALTCAVLGLCPLAWASPGAHGPNGEHLDDANAPGGAAGTAPRFEAQSEGFEMVGRLAGGELSMFINRFETNEPVNGAKVELELGKLKATAPFQADQGDYTVADEAFLRALATPGQHALVITLVAGSESDLLEGTLEVPAVAVDDHGHEDGVSRLAVGAFVAVVLLAVGAVGWRVRGKRRTRQLSMQRVTP